MFFRKATDVIRRLLLWFAETTQKEIIFEDAQFVYCLGNDVRHHNMHKEELDI